MDISRRWFIGGLASAGLAGYARLFTASAGLTRRDAPLLSVGILSDVHIRLLKNRSFEGLATFKHALEWFRDRGADAVQISGDIADHGLVEELQAAAGAWEETFPGSKAPDGRKVEKLFVFGNHDWEGWKYGDAGLKLFGKKYFDHALRKDLAGNFERILGEKYSPVWRKEVKGYAFIGSHWAADRCRAADETGAAHAAEWFAANGGSIDPSRPFFYIQHPHPKNTCYGSWAWGRDDGRLVAALSKFPNAVAFSGHSHYTLTDDRSVWQGAFTSIGAGSLKYTATEYGDPPEGHENGASCVREFRRQNAGKVMKKISTHDGHQGMLMRVYADRIVLERVAFDSPGSLGGDWVLPLPCAENKPFDFSARKKALPVPEFAPGASVAVKKTSGKTRGGKKAEVYEFSIPAAGGKPGARVFEYAIRGEGADGAARERRVLAAGFHLPADSAKARAATVCRINAAFFPKGPLKFTVQPLNSMGGRGAPVSAAAGGKA